MTGDERIFIEIDSENFELVNEVDNIPMADSFIKRNNKLLSTTGHGESKLYVGAKNRMDFDDFFGDFSSRAFFLKNDFINYLDDAKFEYEQQEQKYRQDISASWEEYRQQLKSFSDREFFNLERAVPQDKARYYITSDDAIFKYFRSVMLPIISYVSILKLKDTSANTLFLFRPLLSYSFNPYYHPTAVDNAEKAINKKKIPPTQKEQLVKARLGQGIYRQKLLEESSECIITRVNDERILIASHIKPWSISSDGERLDPNNGLVLTPTYDKLFDQGFISFENGGNVLISQYISPLNIKKLNLIPGKKYRLTSSKKRKEYLSYHREYIFKK